MLRTMLKPLSVVAVGVFVFASGPSEAQPVTSGDRCNEWVSCSGECCDTPEVCDILCPNWISATCSGSQIYCLEGPSPE